MRDQSCVLIVLAGKMGQSYPLRVTCFNPANMTKELVAGLNSLLPQGNSIMFQEKVFKQFWQQLSKSLTHPQRVKSKKATIYTCSWNLSITLMVLSFHCILWQNALLNWLVHFGYSDPMLACLMMWNLLTSTLFPIHNNTKKNLANTQAFGFQAWSMTQWHLTLYTMCHDTYLFLRCHNIHCQHW